MFSGFARLAKTQFTSIRPELARIKWLNDADRKPSPEPDDPL
jgi:hypothetical protein